MTNAIHSSYKNKCCLETFVKKHKLDEIENEINEGRANENEEFSRLADWEKDFLDQLELINKTEENNRKSSTTEQFK